MSKQLRVCATCDTEFTPSGPRSTKCAPCAVKRCSNCNEPLPQGRTGKTCSKECANESRNRSRNVPEKHCESFGCSEVFSPISFTAKYCDKQHTSNCEDCETTFNTAPTIKKSPLCPDCKTLLGNKNRKAGQKKAFLEKYGVESPFHVKEVQEKVKETNVRKYGVENQFQREEIQEQTVETNLKLYGVEHNSQREDVKEKAKETNLSKRGVPHHMQDPTVKEKAAATNLERYGHEYAVAAPEVRERINQTNMERYGVATPFESPQIREKAKEAHLEQYGVESPFSVVEVQEKIKATNLQKYGVDNPARNPSVQEKMKETNRERYGGNSPFSDPAVQEKSRKTLWEAYGVDHPAKSEELVERYEQTMLERHGVRRPLQNPEIAERQRQTMLDRYGVEYALQSAELLAKSMENYSTSGKPRPRISQLNRRFAETLKERFGCDVEFEKTVGTMAYDLYVPEKNMLIELNPTVTHNSDVSFACVLNGCELPCGTHAPIARDYHYKRSLNARENGFRLVHLYDWDDTERTLSLLGGKLAPLQKVSARKMRVVRIKQRDANKFLNEHHYQGGGQKQLHCYGLVHGSSLVAVATFGPSRFGNKAEFEFLRYAVDRDYIIHGGANKLFRSFVREIEPTSVVSYIDFNHTTTDTFLPSLGFNEIAPSGPQLVWHNVKSNKRVYHNSLVRQGADRLLGTSYGPREVCGLGNEEIMVEERFTRVFTAGNRVFLWNTN